MTDASQISSYARQLEEAHGTAAIFEAARKASEYEKHGDIERRDVWRRVELALKERLGPHES